MPLKPCDKTRRATVPVLTTSPQPDWNTSTMELNAEQKEAMDRITAALQSKRKFLAEFTNRYLPDGTSAGLAVGRKIRTPAQDLEIVREYGSMHLKAVTRRADGKPKTIRRLIVTCTTCNIVYMTAPPHSPGILCQDGFLPRKPAPCDSEHCAKIRKRLHTATAPEWRAQLTALMLSLQRFAASPQGVQLPTEIVFLVITALGQSLRAQEFRSLSYRRDLVGKLVEEIRDLANEKEEIEAGILEVTQYARSPEHGLVEVIS